MGRILGMENNLLKRITRTEKNPRVALEQGWVQDPKFCRAFFDRCEHLAFILAPGLRSLAMYAVEFADSHGDPHLLHRSHSVLAHAYLNSGRLFWAGKTLREARRGALACCPKCRSDHLRCEGDLLGEQRAAKKSIAALDRALVEGGNELTDDDRARIFFLRAIAYYHAGHRGRALADARRTLELMSLSSPRGYFLDTAAFIAVYLRGGDLDQDRLAAQSLSDFGQRIKGRRGWRNMRTRSNWTQAHIDARLGNLKYAHRHFEGAWGQLLENGLPREATACTLDRCILLCRRGEPYGENSRTALRLIDRCLRDRPDLTALHREGFGKMQDVLRRHPENAFRELVAFRRSFIAPVPSVMAERFEG